MAVAMVLKVLLIFSYLVYRFAIGVQKAPETCGYSIDMRGTVPGIYESLRQRVAAWRRCGMQKKWILLPLLDNLNCLAAEMLAFRKTSKGDFATGMA